MQEENPKRCNKCELVERVRQLDKCAACKCVRYCSKACQRLDWPEHKHACQRLRHAEATKVDRLTGRAHSMALINVMPKLVNSETFAEQRALLFVIAAAKGPGTVFFQASETADPAAIEVQRMLRNFTFHTREALVRKHAKCEHAPGVKSRQCACEAMIQNVDATPASREGGRVLSVHVSYHEKYSDEILLGNLYMYERGVTEAGQMVSAAPVPVLAYTDIYKPD